MPMVLGRRAYLSDLTDEQWECSASLVPALSPTVPRQCSDLHKSLKILPDMISSFSLADISPSSSAWYFASSTCINSKGVSLPKQTLFEPRVFTAFRMGFARTALPIQVRLGCCCTTSIAASERS